MNAEVNDRNLENRIFPDTFFAHSLPDRPIINWQRLEVHMSNVAQKAAEFASAFESGDWAYSAGLLHDFGKADDTFQAYLLRENGLDDSGYDESGKSRVNHSSAGAALAEERLGRFIGRVLAYLVAGHHAGLPDWDSSDTGNAALSIRLREGHDNAERIKKYAEKIICTLPALERPPRFIRPDNFHLWIRILYSCLVDADFLDTEAFVEPEKSEQRTAAAAPGLIQLKRLFDTNITEMSRGAAKTRINEIRNQVLSSCRAKAQEAPGLFSLTVPTGGGKTLSSMAFALDHAMKHGKSRIIYVIPYTSIIEQIGEVLSGIFGRENIIEHHSNLDPDKETPRSRLASENWDAPLVITTNVQFFESLYSAKSSRCRKLHNIVNSIVILDEAQLLPPELLTPCVDAINHLSRDFGVTFLFSTATQPALPKLNPVREIIDNPTQLYSDLNRTEFIFPASYQESTDWATLAKELNKHSQVLCIVNTRKDCYDLFQCMPEDTIHLSALMCGAHRSEKISEIRQKLRQGESVRVISTQLVEAGVDIDFPVVYRAVAGLDSLVQAAGRCNREGKLSVNGQLGRVFVFVPPKRCPLGLLRKGEDLFKEIATLPGFDIGQPHIFAQYFESLYGRLNDTGQRFLEILVKDVNPDLKIHFRTAGQNFRLINDQGQRPVFVRFQGNDAVLNQFRFVGPNRQILRILQRFTVNLPIRMVNQMLANGLLEEVHEGYLIQALPSLYDRDMGLNVFREHLPVEDLIQ